MKLDGDYYSKYCPNCNEEIEYEHEGFYKNHVTWCEMQE